MGEALKKTENNFFVWLPSVAPPYMLEEIRSSYKAVSSILVLHQDRK